jgi:large subunit ribosomal protein L35e
MDFLMFYFFVCIFPKLREKFAGSKHMPIDLRAKKTRAIRRRLTPEQASKKTLRQQKISSNFPKRVYAVKAAV